MTRHLPEPERRAQILGAARTLFVERGFLATRMEDVAQRAQLSKGAVYFYFPSKQAILEELSDQELARVESILGDFRNSALPADQLLISLGWRYLSMVGSEDREARFFLTLNEMAIRDGAMAERARRIHNHFLGALTELIARGVAEGSFRAVDPAAAAGVVKALIDGLAGHAAIGVLPTPAGLAMGGIDVILRGLLPTESPP